MNRACSVSLFKLSLFSIALVSSTNVFADELLLDTTWCGVAGPTRIACDQGSQILYVTAPLDHAIVVYDLAGNIVNTIETSGPPGAICLADPGNLIVSIDRSVYKIATSGEIVTTYGLVNDYFVDPHDVEWAGDGRVFVADDDDSIKVFDATGESLFSFGGYGYIDGKLDEPVAICFNPLTDELLVTDQNNYRLQAFDLSGNYLRNWGTEGNGFVLSGSYFRPFGIDVDGEGRIWTFDILLDLIQVYDSLGAFSFSMPLNTFEMRGGIDLAVDGDLLYISAPSTGCIFVYGISSGTTPEVNPPFELTILWTEAGVRLDWNPQLDAVGYRVQRSTDFEFSELLTEELGYTADTSYTDELADNLDVVNYYRVSSDATRLTPTALAGELRERERRNGLDTEHDAPHHVTHGVNCNSCHLRPYDEPNPRPEWWVGDHLCKSCHVETGFALAVQTHLGTDTISCNVCHSPHYHQPQFERYFIRNENPVGESEHMLFNHETDFIHGAPNYDGICEICHTQTSYYRNNESGDHTHNSGSDCVTCHRHEKGFIVENETSRIARP